MTFFATAAFARAGLAAVAAIMLAGPAAAEPAASAWSVTDQTRVRLVAATTAVNAGEQVRLGLQFELKEGWKVYWRSPGDAGYPPHVDWSESENLAGTDFAWPAPQRFSVLGLETLGYKKEVVFPITARAAEHGKPVHLRARLDYLTCDDICIPYQAKLDLDLPAGDGVATGHAHLISQYAARVPGDGAAHGLAIQRAETAGAPGPVKDGFREGMLWVVARSQTAFDHPDLFVEGPDSLIFAKPELMVTEAGTKLTALVPVTLEAGATIETANLTVTVTDGARAAEQALTVLAGPAEAEANPLPVSLPLILGLALLGGLILNLMPCVLPVISLKVLGVVGHGGGENRLVRRSFLATSAGILFSFLVLASALTGLKYAGAAVGWGIQFQQPWFLVALTLIVTLFAYNLWGLFEVRLPARLATLIASPEHGDGQGLTGNFLTGAFATVLATPCSAPFLGTAVGFALAGSTADIYAVFTALGLGMAAPFLAIALAPSLATRLPRPGAWMMWVKKVMGLALAATAVWLISVLAIQVSFLAAIAVGALMLVLGGVLWTRARLALAGAVVVAAAAFAVPSVTMPRVDFAEAAKSGAHWVAFEPERIPALVADGKTVFVDITAEWCITCQVNKTAVLNRGAVAELLKSADVVAMQGDWTRPDPVISAYLARFNRFGIPFNAVYGPGAGKPVVLPELLTAGVVLDGMHTASAGALAAR